MKLLKNVLKTVAGIIMAAAMTIQPVMPAWSYENDSTTQETGVNIYVFNVCQTNDYSSDAILIENNGHYAMVDVGEDKDYPKGPYFHKGTVTEEYVDENFLIKQLQGMGVKKIDYLILTHAHSDHMGAADEVINAFDIGTIYAQEYSDEYISSTSALYDSQYVYNKMAEAAKNKKIPVVSEINDTNDKITLGDTAVLQIYNYGFDYETDANGDYKLDRTGKKIRKQVDDDNENSLGVLVKDASGHKAFLAGDICNMDGDEDRLAQIDELKNVDIMKLGHHGYANTGSDTSKMDTSTKDYIDALSPSKVIITNAKSRVNSKVIANLENVNAEIYYTACYSKYVHVNLATLDVEGVDVYNGPQYSTVVKDYFFYQNGFRLKDTTAVYEGNTYKISPTFIIYRNHWEQDKNDNYVYYGDDGAMIKNQVINIDDKMYGFDEDGLCRRGQWLDYQNDRYYLGSDYYAVKGLNTILGKDYIFGDNYAMLTNRWYKILNQWYYVDSNGEVLKMHWMLSGNDWYFLGENGAMYKNHWYNYKNDWYYFGDDGAMYYNKWLYWKDKWYFFGGDGIMITNSWYDYNDNWYYFDGDGAAYTEQWYNYKDEWYYFDEDAKMVTSAWVYYNEAWYYFDEDGIMCSSQWIDYNGCWYYANEDGAMVTDSRIEYDGSSYYFDEDGVMR